MDSGTINMNYFCLGTAEEKKFVCPARLFVLLVANGGAEGVTR